MHPRLPVIVKHPKQPYRNKSIRVRAKRSQTQTLIWFITEGTPVADSRSALSLTAVFTLTLALRQKKTPLHSTHVLLTHDYKSDGRLLLSNCWPSSYEPSEHVSLLLGR